MTDRFLDRVKWIKNSWPLVHEDFHNTLASQLATLRQSYVCDIIKDCAKTARMPDKRISEIILKWSLATPESKIEFALHLIKTLKNGLIHKPHQAEVFNSQIIKENGIAVLTDYHLKLTRE